jgi:branched-chain amino acid transport system ATP-binding protein
MTEGGVLELENVTKKFGGLVALDEVSLSLKGNELLGLIGPNGAGKSTLVNVTTGIYPATGGSIRFRGEPVTSVGMSRIARKGLLRTFQKPNHFEEYTGQENLEVAHGKDKVLTKKMFFSGLFDSSASLNGELSETINMLNIGPELLEKRPEDMNHLELRKLEIGRVMVNDPNAILLDEPFAGLTSEEIDTVSQFITDIYDRGIPVLLIDHNVGKVTDIADRVAVLDQGRILTEGEPEEIMEDERVESAYFGE